MADTPILELKTLIERPLIAIDGKKYQILSPEELSVVDAQRFTLWGERIKTLTAEGDAKALDELINDIAARIMVGVPDTVAASLSGIQKMSVVEVFTVLLLQRKMALAGAITATMPVIAGQPTGATSSPASSVSTAGRRGGGSSKRRSR